MDNPSKNEIRAVCNFVLSNYADACLSNVTIPNILQNMTNMMLSDPSLLQDGIKAMMALTNYSEAQLGRLTKKYYK